MASVFDDIGMGSLEGLSLSGFEQWILLGINIILSTIIGGVVLLIVVGIISKKYGEGVEFGNAFVMALVVNIVNFLGVMGILMMFLPIPFLAMLLPLLVWIGLAKFFFSQMSFTHILMVAVIGFVLTMFLVPPISAYVRGFVPI